MNAVLLAAVLSTLTFEGEIDETDGDYVVVDFEVPEGVVEIHVAHSDGSQQNVLDWGVWSPSGFRGWGGGLEDDAVVGAVESSRGYLPGPIEAGTWSVVIGVAVLDASPATYDITVTLHDAATLSPRERATPQPGDLGGGARWYAGDLHVHSSESGDASASMDAIAALASERGLDFVVLSDHNTVSQHALASAFQDAQPELLFVRGAEITTYAGHGNGLGIASYVDHRVGLGERSAAAIVADVTAQGGAFVVNHPALDLGDACIGCAWTHEDTPWDQVAAIEIHTGPYDVWPIFGRTVLALWDDLQDQGHRITAVGGSDDHRATGEVTSTRSPIGSPTTMVHAESLSEEAILEAIRAGRVVVKLRGPDDPMAELSVTGEDGAVGRLGDTIASATVVLEARVTGGDGSSVLLVKNGAVVESAAVDGDDVTLRFEQETSAAGDRYRVHVLDGTEATVTNHVYVDWAEPLATGDEGGCGCRTSGGAGSGLLALSVLALMRRRRR